MAGALFNQVRRDNQKFIETGGYETDVTITSKNKTVTIIAPGSVTLHNTQIDPDTGGYANVKQAHLLINTQTLIDAGFPVYTSTKRPNDPILKKALIEFADANGKVHKMIADDVRPSNTFGCITILLGEYEE